MELHKPKPVHNWRELLSEIGVIVIGVLIALGAEQVVVAFHNEYLAEQARHDARAEASINLAFLDTRLREGPCVARKLDEVDALLHDPKATLGSGPVWVGRPQDLPIYVERWRAATSSARTALFSSREQGLFDNLYTVLLAFRDDEHHEQAAWTDLRVLEHWTGPIDPAQRFTLLRAIAAARHADYEIRVHGYFANMPAKQLGLAPNPDFGSRKGDPDSLCLPLNTPPAVARRIVRDYIPDEE